ncbi:hypothetical protein PISMIDRAFT_682172 [Pisolithus microcarpus 441]|uniref:Unplaced genomic scaffold scaffold_77, whole genome shotgun sequence n=1 Tax=Pisolithus microcarpus 441 TaxID=765257 RepID=A0A0C9ZDU2_9AGAM|nr:hypothetical protein PISMIDRAFT_682172 [Pisolithus microcarpus 441]
MYGDEAASWPMSVFDNASQQLDLSLADSFSYCNFINQTTSTTWPILTSDHHNPIQDLHPIHCQSLVAPQVPSINGKLCNSHHTSLEFSQAATIPLLCVVHKQWTLFSGKQIFLHSNLQGTQRLGELGKAW